MTDIYQNENSTKSYVYLAAQPDKPNIFTIADKNEHRPKRKLISHVLSDHSMRKFESSMLAQIDIFLKQILYFKSSAYNMTPACRHMGLNIAGKLGFGFDLGLQTDDTNRSLPTAITLGNHKTNACMQFTTLAVLLKPGFIVNMFTSSLRARLMDMLMSMIKSRLAKPSDAEQDLLAVYAEQSDSDIKNIKQQSLWAEAVFFFAAGGETIASTLSAAFFYLSRNAEIYEKLAEEIRTTFQSADEIRGGSKLSGCRYLRACIDETMRMSPPVPSTLWREAVKGQSLVVDGHAIPPGTQVGVNIYSLHHNEEYFPDSFKFDPERWMPGAQPGRAHHAAFTPFSFGSRGCAGKSMAYLEMSLVLAKTLWYFDFQRASSGAEKIMGDGISGFTHHGGEETEFPMYNLFAAGHDGPVLKFTSRGTWCDELQ
ncbi:hypothetical protein PFICI_08340 [Pestalotiopsis fici W106-1]|uniref:Uncharacterized protein n=1 Tax=Pestalotiopsis fici (strain W106-1 / CGMCC3.15140) TaxID=1229662 RepID=W3X6L0_PESFW|nr:uncharacterized protein PFICI_08340 [Pestalotiopsis fici W106-1]ETS80811.1 hypothetical protein PFICI_08340 [Pestalotiopsis fici W106-1]